MKKLLLIISFLAVFVVNAKSQNKTIQGDTAFWYKYQQELIEQLDLKDYTKTSYDFVFRLKQNKQIIEIIKDKDVFSGSITNYIHWFRERIRTKRDTFQETMTLDSNEARIAFDLIQSSKILELPSDNEIEGWSGGTDGITYIVEYADSNNYWFKNYWTPSAQDSLEEALIVSDFIKQLTDTLDLSEKYQSFRNGLPKKGCYNLNGIMISCYSRPFHFSYTGSDKLPFGYNTSYYLGNIGNIETNLGMSLKHQFDRFGNYDISTHLGRNEIFFNEKNEINDAVIYNYRIRSLDFIEPNQAFQNHNIRYQLYFDNGIGVGLGADFLRKEINETGVSVHSYKRFDNAELSFYSQASFFNDNVNYEVGVSKHFIANRLNPLDVIWIDFYFERFQKHNFWNWSLSLSF